MLVVDAAERTALLRHGSLDIPALVFEIAQPVRNQVQVLAATNGAWRVSSEEPGGKEGERGGRSDFVTKLVERIRMYYY